MRLGGGSIGLKACQCVAVSRTPDASQRGLRRVLGCVLVCALSLVVGWKRSAQAMQGPAAAVAGSETAAPKGDPAASASRRVFLLGDNAFSAGSVTKILQSFFAARGEAAELREIPLKGKPLLEAAEAVKPEDVGPQDALVVFDHPLRPVVQRLPDQTANDLATLSEWLPVRYVLLPSPLLNDALYRERRLAVEAAARGTPTIYLPLVSALKQAQSQAAGRPWQSDLSFDRATLLTDYLTACLLYASLSGRSPQGLPADIPLDEKTSLHVAPDAAEVLQRAAEATPAAGLRGESPDFDYDPGLQSPMQVFAAGSPVAVSTEGLQPHIVDWNGDGVHDLVAAGVKAGCADIFLVQKTAEGFTAAAGIPLDACRLWADLQPQGVTVSQFLDWDGNGTTDILLLTGRGEVWLAASPKAGEWAAPRALSGAKGEPLRLAYAVSAWGADLDQDGDADLLLGDEAGQVWIAWNGGTGAEEAFEEPQAVSIGGLDLMVDRDAAAAAADWDCDSRPDLILGSHSGAVYWCRGLKSEGRPSWAPPLTLIEPCCQENPAGTPQRPGAPLWAPVPGWSSRPAVVDWNGDHWPDLFLGDSNRKVVKYRELTAEEEADLK
ncbi:MAG: VCBS repeat-containing protein, partial [Thermogutta sp.]|nr:VCBS repeat-containing protein [Thermogutta sp.]